MPRKQTLHLELSLIAQAEIAEMLDGKTRERQGRIAVTYVQRLRTERGLSAQ